MTDNPELDMILAEAKTAARTWAEYKRLKQEAERLTRTLPDSFIRALADTLDI